MMNFDKRDKKRTMEHFSTNQNSKSKGAESENLCLNLVGSSKTAKRVKEGPDRGNGFILKRCDSNESLETIIYKDSVIQISTAPKKYDHSKKLECMNKTARLSNNKPDLPCTCENCRLMDILRNSQKIPFADNICRSRNKERRRQVRWRREVMNRDEREKRNKMDFKEHALHRHYYEQLLHRIKDLEERLKIQEETTIPKVELEKLISSILINLVAYRNQDKPSISSERGHAKEVNCSLNKPFNSQPPFVTEQHPGSSRNHERGFCDKKTSPIPSYNYFWKWRGNMLKPGIDIKNKILLLVEGVLKKIPQGIKKPDFTTFIADTFKKVFLNASVAPERKISISIEKNVHNSDTPLRMSYIKPVRWEEFDSSLKDIYKQKFNTIVHNISQEDRQGVWDAVRRQCLIYGYDKSNRATINFHHKKRDDRIRVPFTVEELENLLIGKKTGTM